MGVRISGLNLSGEISARFLIFSGMLFPSARGSVNFEGHEGSYCKLLQNHFFHPERSEGSGCLASLKITFTEKFRSFHRFYPEMV
jgi:hypothetical protein